MKLSARPSPRRPASPVAVWISRAACASWPRLRSLRRHPSPKDRLLLRRSWPASRSTRISAARSWLYTHSLTPWVRASRMTPSHVPRPRPKTWPRPARRPSFETGVPSARVVRLPHANHYVSYRTKRTSCARRTLSSPACRRESQNRVYRPMDGRQSTGERPGRRSGPLTKPPVWPTGKRWRGIHRSCMDTRSTSFIDWYPSEPGLAFNRTVVIRGLGLPRA